jgi:hypothetical protein
MPLLLHSNSASLDENELNRVKRKLNKSSITQYLKIGNIRSTIQPTKSQISDYFSRTLLVLKNIKNSFNLINNVNNAEFEMNRAGLAQHRQNLNNIAQKMTIEYLPQVQEFIQFFELSIYPVYNYFNPQQNQQIKSLLEQINILGISLQDEELDNGDLQYYIQFVSDSLDLLGQAVDSYSPLRINLKRGLKDEEVSGGYIGGSIFRKDRVKNEYPEIRFR